MIYDRINETWNFLMDENGRISPPAPVRAMGTWIKMKPVVERYYGGATRDIRIEEGEYYKICLYTIRKSRSI